MLDLIKKVLDFIFKGDPRMTETEIEEKGDPRMLESDVEVSDE